jgi:hypothetical protein
MFRSATTARFASDARLTTDPANDTGASSATGATLPVLPTCHVTPSSVVSPTFAGHFHAIAPRGYFDVVPAASNTRRLATRSTTPSIS